MRKDKEKVLFEALCGLYIVLALCVGWWVIRKERARRREENEYWKACEEVAKATEEYDFRKGEYS